MVWHGIAAVAGHGAWRQAIVYARLEGVPGNWQGDRNVYEYLYWQSPIFDE